MENIKQKQQTAISEAKLVNMIEDGLKKGANIVSFSTTTDARLKKKGNPYKGVVKTARVNGMIGFNYANAVNNQIAREKELEEETKRFMAMPRQWGERKNLAIVVHKGQLYLTAKIERVLESPEYYDSKGNFLTKDQVKPFLPKRKEEGARQGVEKKIIIRDYKILSIDEITMNKVRYVIVH